MSRPLRVVQMLPFLDVGGVETLRLAFARQLARDAQGRSELDVRFCALARGGSVAEELTRLGFDVTALGCEPHPLNPVTTRRVAVWLRQQPVDIVHTACLEANIHAALGRRWARLPVLITEEAGVAHQRPGWARWLSGRAHRSAACAVAHSGSVKAYLTQCETVPAEHVRVLYNCAPFEPTHHRPDQRAARRAIGCPEQGMVVGCVGRLVPEKNYPLLLDAFAQVAREQPVARLVIVGDGPEREPLVAHSQRLGITAQTRFLGHVPTHDVLNILPALDVFVLASRTEGLPIALVEAMMAGLPVVATAVDGICEVIRHGQTGWLVPSGDAQALARTLLTVLSDPASTQQVADRGHAEASIRFSARRYTQELCQLYQSFDPRAERASSDGARPAREVAESPAMV